MSSIKNIIFFGAGNVASHMAVALKKKGFRILQVYSRTSRSAKQLAVKVKADAVVSISSIRKDADLYIVSVSDNVLQELLFGLDLHDRLIVHTSGFHELRILKNVSLHYGVLYPLQTFSRNQSVDFSKVPICIEAGKSADVKRLKSFASVLTSDIRVMDSTSRRIVHLAAIFACNFSNFMYSVAEEILSEKKIPFEVLRPLILETALKVMKENPGKVQTGPARRGDGKVMEQHLKMLSDKDQRDLYKKISRLISEKYVNNFG